MKHKFYFRSSFFFATERNEIGLPFSFFIFSPPGRKRNSSTRINPCTLVPTDFQLYRKMKHKFYFRFSFFSAAKKRNWTFIVVFRFFPAGKETEFEFTTCSLFFFFVTFPNCIRNHVIAYTNKAVFINFALENFTTFFKFLNQSTTN